MQNELHYIRQPRCNWSYGMNSMTVQGIQCPRCGEKIWSRHRHDFRYCTCRYSHVDGGRDYLKYGWGVDLPPGMHNDGTVPREVWEAKAAEELLIGRPEVVDIEVEVRASGGTRKAVGGTRVATDVELWLALEKINRDPASQATQNYLRKHGKDK